MGFNPGCEIFLESKGFDEYSVVNCRGVKVALGKNQTKYISIAEIIPEGV
jgi:Fe2+ transport system protein FeoA